MIVLLMVVTAFFIVGFGQLALGARAGSAVYWTILGVGTSFLVLVLVGVVMYLVLSIKEIGLNQRQSNFIDSVTHELKSPIASLKLYLQTLVRRTLADNQRSDFYRFMLQDVERLDSLINHLLDAARLDEQPVENNSEDVHVDEVLRACAQAATTRYHLGEEGITLDLSPGVMRGRPMEVEMVFRNLVDNAVKYAGKPPRVILECKLGDENKIITRISDNGPGIPTGLRRKIFGRFVRLGNELERSKKGTGLGLYIVRKLVHKMKGRITVRGRGTTSGTIFEVELPGLPTPVEVTEP